MNPLFGLLSLLLVNLAMATSPFAGNWKLLEAFDENLEAVALPTGSYTLSLIDTDPQGIYLRLLMKVGNTLRSKVTLVGGDGAIEVSGIMSTMMMPPEPQYRLEMYLSKTFPLMTTLAMDGSHLVFEGEGRIVFEIDTEDEA